MDLCRGRAVSITWYHVLSKTFFTNPASDTGPTYHFITRFFLSRRRNERNCASECPRTGGGLAHHVPRAESRAPDRRARRHRRLSGDRRLRSTASQCLWRCLWPSTRFADSRHGALLASHSCGSCPTETQTSYTRRSSSGTSLMVCSPASRWCRSYRTELAPPLPTASARVSP